MNKKLRETTRLLFHQVKSPVLSFLGGWNAFGNPPGGFFAFQQTSQNIAVPGFECPLRLRRSNPGYASPLSVEQPDFFTEAAHRRKHFDTLVPGHRPILHRWP